MSDRESQYFSSEERELLLPVADLSDIIDKSLLFDDLDPDGHPRRLGTCTCNRRVSMFWKEKALLLFQFFQLYGLLWTFAIAWPWAHSWQKWSRYWALFSLHSMIESLLGLLFCSISTF